MRYIFDWCPRYNKALIQSENLEEVRLHFSQENKGASIGMRRRGRYYNSRKYAITATGRFGLGLLPSIVDFIKETDDNAIITVTEPLKKKFLCGFDFYNKDIVPLKHDYRDYQEDIIRKSIKHGWGTNVVATAGGKTLIMCGLLWSILKYNPNFKAIVILPPQLVHQTYTDFLEYGVNPQEVSRWDGDNAPDRHSKVVVASSSILLSKKQDTDWVKNVDIVIGDECHKSKNGNKITKFIESIKTTHKFGFTGTLPDDRIDEWKVYSLFGPVLQEKSSADLRDSKYISDVEINILRIFYDQEPEYVSNSGNASQGYRKEIDFIVNSEDRNDLIGKICKKLNKNTLILVDRIQHGEKIEKKLRECTKDKEIYFIHGDVEKDERNKIKQLMEAQDNIICVAMGAIFSTGISINNIHYIIFGAGGKAKTRIVQSIGRGLRLHPRKTKLIVFDLTDMLKYGERHYQKRLLLYDKERILYHVRNIKASQKR